MLIELNRPISSADSYSVDVVYILPEAVCTWYASKECECIYCMYYSFPVVSGNWFETFLYP